MGDEDIHSHSIGAHEGGQVYMGVVTNFLTLLGSAHALGKKEVG